MFLLLDTLCLKSTSNNDKVSLIFIEKAMSRPVQVKHTKIYENKINEYLR